MRCFIRKRAYRVGFTYYLCIASVLCTYGQTHLTKCKKDSLKAKVIETASSQVGVREATGNNDGIEVESYLRAVGLKKGNPYCVAGLYWCFLQNDIHLNISNPAYSPNWFTGTMKVVYRKGQSPLNFKADTADIAGFYIGGKGRIGHGEIIKYELHGMYRTTGFNTSGSDTDNGDGVRDMWRKKTQIYIISRPLESRLIWENKTYN